MPASVLQFLIDEDVPVSVGEFLADSGYGVARVFDIMPGADDAAVLALAENMRCVLVTKNKRHFNRLAPRESSPTARRYHHAGVVYICCKEVLARKRIEHWIDLIEFEWARSRRFADTKVIIEMRETLLRIAR
jgi:predicted nuclease of predicted toxin-antitoxin system